MLMFDVVITIYQQRVELCRQFDELCSLNSADACFKEYFISRRLLWQDILNTHT